MLKNETTLWGGQFEQSSNGFQKLVLQFWVSFQVCGLAILTFKKLYHLVLFMKIILI